MSAWVSTPPVTARVSSTMVMPSLFSGGRGGTHPLAVGPVTPGLLHRTGRSDRHAGGGPKNLDPAGRSFRRTAEAASAESEVRPGPRPPTLRPHHRKTAQAGPEALSTVSLPPLSS